jgi:cell division protein FtsI/penicillin-binding protein 2
VLCDVVVRGTATGARSETWNLFSKTGTAHISEGKAGYSHTKFNSSFICGAPAENPKLVAAFIIHEPDRAIAHYGGSVSGPAAKEFMERALTYLQVAPSPELQPPPPDVTSVLVNFDPKVYKPRPKKKGTGMQTADVRD